jgi:hypothetical protein
VQFKPGDDRRAYGGQMGHKRLKVQLKRDRGWDREEADPTTAQPPPHRHQVSDQQGLVETGF